MDNDEREGPGEEPSLSPPKTDEKLQQLRYSRGGCDIENNASGGAECGDDSGGFVKVEVLMEDDEHIYIELPEETCDPCFQWVETVHFDGEREALSEELEERTDEVDVSETKLVVTAESENDEMEGIEDDDVKRTFVKFPDDMISEQDIPEDTETTVYMGSLTRECEPTGNMFDLEGSSGDEDTSDEISEPLDAPENCGGMRTRARTMGKAARTSARKRNRLTIPTSSPNNDYSCSHCGKTFCDPHHHRSHEKLHLGIQKYQYPICSKMLVVTPSGLHEHHNSVVGGGPKPKGTFRGPASRMKLVGSKISPGKTPDPAEIPASDKTDDDNVSEDGDLFLRIRLPKGIDWDDAVRPCFVPIPRSSALQLWEQSASTKTRKFNEPAPCPFCSHICSRKDILKEHIGRNHTKEEDRQYPCPKCPRKFSVAVDLKKHVFSVHTWGVQRCPQSKCNMIGTQANLTRHLLRVHKLKEDRRNHECGKCGRRYIDQKLLNQHIQRMHKTDTAPLAPPSVSPPQSQTSEVIVYARKSLPPPLPLDEQQQELPPISLDYLMELPLPPLSLVDEPELLSSPPKLTLPDPLSPLPEVRKQVPSRKKRAGRGGRNRKKSVPRQVRRKTTKVEKVKNLNQQNYLKNQLTAFICLFCGKEFQHYCRLEVHMNAHFNEYPYECSHCSEVYLYPSSLWHHVSKYHDEQQVDCDLCGENCHTKVLLRRHMEEMHNQGRRKKTLRSKRKGQLSRKELRRKSSRLRRGRSGLSLIKKQKSSRSRTRRKNLKNKKSPHPLPREGKALINDPETVPDKKILQEEKLRFIYKTRFARSLSKRSWKRRTSTVLSVSQKRRLHKLQRKRKERSSSIKCNFCSSVFKSKTARNSHVVTRHGAMPYYLCSFCTSSFPTRTELNRHACNDSKSQGQSSSNSLFNHVGVDIHGDEQVQPVGEPTLFTTQMTEAMSELPDVSAMLNDADHKFLQSIFTLSP